MSVISDEEVTDILRVLGMPSRTQLEVDRCAAMRQFDVALVYGIHGARSAVTDCALEDTIESERGDLVREMLEVMRDLLVPVVVTAAARAWAELHLPEGLPCR